MKRRKFIVNGSMGLLSHYLSNTIIRIHDDQYIANNDDLDLSNLKGFNLLEKFTTWGNNERFREFDFAFMAEYGFNFARIPMTYRSWSSSDDWYTIDESIIQHIDELINFGIQYGVHINLNLHRIPGYCILGIEEEPHSLFADDPDSASKALDAATFHWTYFAKRYKNISNKHVSFDLINEPPDLEDPSKYVSVILHLADEIKKIDPDRFIVVDGLKVGRDPIWALEKYPFAQSTRGYEPMAISHYEASWVDASQLEQEGVPSWPFIDKEGNNWDRLRLREKLISPWEKLAEKGVAVHVGEWGAYNRTPHPVSLAWMEDLLHLWKEMSWGNALWNLRGPFGVMDSQRTDVQYENYKSHRLDRKMLELLLKYK